LSASWALLQVFPSILRFANSCWTFSVPQAPHSLSCFAQAAILLLFVSFSSTLLLKPFVMLASLSERIQPKVLSVSPPPSLFFSGFGGFFLFVPPLLSEHLALFDPNSIPQLGLALGGALRASYFFRRLWSFKFSQFVSFFFRFHYCSLTPSLISRPFCVQLSLSELRQCFPRLFNLVLAPRDLPCAAESLFFY